MTKAERITTLATLATPIYVALLAEQGESTLKQLATNAIDAAWGLLRAAENKTTQIEARKDPREEIGTGPIGVNMDSAVTATRLDMPVPQPPGEEKA